ncbi:hypothetical protein LIT32_27355 (plasmid) [Bacillus sp. CMF21]|nr:hypothetical protein LIT32_27355 [Bacillus sp. CMF21]
MFLALSLSEATFPTESALIERLSSKEKLTKVISVFAFPYKTLDIICDAISGIIIVFVGLGTIYISNSILLQFTDFLFLFYFKVPISKKASEVSTLGFMRQYKTGFVEVKVPNDEDGYFVHIGSNLENTYKHFQEKDIEVPQYFVMLISRFHRMNPMPGTNHLEVFKRVYKKFGSYFIMLGIINNGQLRIVMN